jgi:phosphatidylglycerophosphate synthase
MFDIFLRELKDKIYLLILTPLFGILLNLKITPNQITILSFLFGIICIYFIYYENILLSILFWLLNRFSDGLDGNSKIKLGIYARKTNQTSDFGGYLDIITDFTVLIYLFRYIH